MSLHQYFDLALASGRVPLNIVLELVESVRDFVIDHPEEPQSPDLYYAWLHKRYEPTTVSKRIMATFTTQEKERRAIMRKALSQHAVEVTVEAVHVDDEDPGEREYSIILQDPDFITSDVSKESYIKIEVQMQKILEDGKLVLIIDTEAYTQE